MNGRILSVAQAQQALAAGAMGGTSSPITININGAGNPNMVAAAVRRELEGITQRADNRARI